MRIKMTIPRSESDRPLLFKDEMMKLFHQKMLLNFLKIVQFRAWPVGAISNYYWRSPPILITLFS